MKDISVYPSCNKNFPFSTISIPTNKKKPAEIPIVENLLFSFQPNESTPPKASDESNRFKESENLEEAVVRASSKNREKRETFFKENSLLSVDSHVQNSNASFKKSKIHHIDIDFLAKSKVSGLKSEQRGISQRKSPGNGLTLFGHNPQMSNTRPLKSPEGNRVDDSNFPFQIRPGFSTCKNLKDSSQGIQKSNSSRVIELGLSANQLSKLSSSGKKPRKMDLLKQISNNTSPMKGRSKTLDQSHSPTPLETSELNLSKYSFFKTKLGYSMARDFQPEATVQKTSLVERRSSTKDLNYNANHIWSNSLKKSLRTEKLGTESDKFNEFYLQSTNQSSKDTIQQTYPLSMGFKAFPSNIKFNVGACFKKQ